MWKKISFHLRDYFGFSGREARGFVGVLALLTLVLLTPAAYRWWMPADTGPLPADQARLDSLLALLEANAPVATADAADPVPRARIFDSKRSTTTAERFAFDPNAINSPDWQRLGLPKYLADRIVNYRHKGGKFRVKKDLLKIYGFPPDRYAALAAYIQLPDSLTREPFAKKTFPDKLTGFPPREDFRPRPFDLNAVDTLALDKLRGVGFGYARRIVRYRERLGGFISADQLAEVYGLDSTTVAEVRRFATLPLGTVRKLNVNVATAEELKSHPYLNWRLANAVVAYRQQHGPYTTAQDLANIKILDAATLRKLAPYLAF